MKSVYHWPALALPAAITTALATLFLTVCGCSSQPAEGVRVQPGADGTEQTAAPVVTFLVQDIPFIQVEAGSFTMGSRGIEPGHENLEQRRDVSFLMPFAVSQYEITREQYWRVMDPSHEVDAAEATMPMTGVSWEGAQEFCQRLASLEPGKRFRLPTEPEWEYVCRAGEQRLYSVWRGENWRSNLDDAVRAYNEGSRSKLSRRAASSFCFDENSASKVGQYKPNPWGFYDMHGNVWEWCNPSGNDLDGDAPTLQHRPIRGGAWSSPSCLDCRSAKRAFEHKGSEKGAIGLRLLIENP